MKTAQAPKVIGTYGTMYYVKDMAKTVEFYKKSLKLKPAYESPEWTEFNLGGPSLCLHLAGGPNEFVNASLIIHVEGIRQYVEDLKAAGVKVTTEVHEVHPGAFAADFRDPSGNVVGLYEGKKGS